MSTKLIVLAALTAALVFGYAGAFGRDNASAGGQAFVSNNPAGPASIDVDYCYDTNPANSQTTVPPAGGAILSRLVCNAANPTTLPTSTAVASWTLINLPVGNRLATPVTFTPSGAGEWGQTAVPCTSAPNADPHHECDLAGPPGGTGDLSARIDIGCDAPNFEIVGELGGSPGSDQTLWGTEPNDAETWPVVPVERIAASVADGGDGPIVGGDNAYIHQTVPFPTGAPNAWTFRTSDLAVLDAVYLAAGTSFAIPPTKLNLVAYASNYPGQSGLIASISLLGGSTDTPPNDSLTLCALQSPADSFTESDVLITPNTTRRIVRWTTLQSEMDRADATGPNFEDDDLTRILDWQCTLIGVDVAAVDAADGGDSDGDCDPDPTDANDSNIDNDGDLVPDGVERAYNSDPNDADTDNDGSNDYTEIFEYTDPNDTDSDDDGQADKPDDTPTNCAPGGPALCGGDDAPGTGSDAANLTDDNCPAVANPNQLNTDSMYQFHGMGAGTGDATNPDEDVWGDACDIDDDNDDMPGATEALVRIAPWGNFAGAPEQPTSVCVGTALSSLLPDDPLLDTKGDTDQDYVLDGMECRFRSRPDQSIRTSQSTGCCPPMYSPDCLAADYPSAGNCANKALNCTQTLSITAGETDDEGCAQPPVASVLSNSDGTGAGQGSDGLYLPGALQNTRVESQYRSQCFNLTTGGACVLNIDGDANNGDADDDSDRDLLGQSLLFGGTGVNIQDGVEVWNHGTFPADSDTDQDGCPEADEINDINGDGTTNSGDQGLFATRVYQLGANLDNNNDGRVDDYALGVNVDINKANLYQIASGDQGLMGAAITAPGSCSVAGQFVEDNVDATALLNLP